MIRPYNLLCIFHNERTPSLRVWPDGWYYCHGCEERGHLSEYRDLYRYHTTAVFREYQRTLEKEGQLRLFHFSA